MTKEQFAEAFIKMPRMNREEVLTSIKSKVTEEQYNATVYFLTSYEIMHDAKMYNMVKDYVGHKLYEQLNAMQ